jgi:hypothetical protein
MVLLSRLAEDLAQLGREGIGVTRLAVLSAQEPVVVTREDDHLGAELQPDRGQLIR